MERLCFLAPSHIDRAFIVIILLFSVLFIDINRKPKSFDLLQSLHHLAEPIANQLMLIDYIFVTLCWSHRIQTNKQTHFPLQFHRRHLFHSLKFHVHFACSFHHFLANKTIFKKSIWYHPFALDGIVSAYLLSLFPSCSLSLVARFVFWYAFFC